MRQAQKKKEKDKIAIVLILCFSVMALTSIFIIKANIDKINENAPGLPVSDETSVQERTEASNSDQPEDVSANVPTVDSLENDKQDEMNPEEPQSVPSEFVFPVKDDNAKISNPYSMDKLIYSLTLDQYMTHSGIDIEAPEDAQVLAVAEGTVTSIYNDDRYGTSIEITHPNKLISVYSNLSTAEMVEVGDVVSRGQIIGGVGSTGLFESLEPSHLHFEMIKDGTYVNPEDYISF